MAQLVQALVLGILIGGVYALMASGLTLIFGVMRIINIAQGAFLILVATVTWWLWRETGIDPIIASVITTPMMFALGWVLYRTVVSRIRGQSASMSVLLTFGIALVIEGILNVASGNKFRSATPGYFEQSFTIGSIHLPKPQVYGFLAALVVLAGLYLVLTRTWTGRAIRAVSQNPSAAALVGVSATGTAALAFALGAAQRRRRRVDPVGALPVLPGLALRLDLPAARDRRARRDGQPAGCDGRRAGARPGRDAHRDVRVAALVDAGVLPGDHGGAAGPARRACSARGCARTG